MADRILVAFNFLLDVAQWAAILFLVIRTDPEAERPRPLRKLTHQPRRRTPCR